MVDRNRLMHGRTRSLHGCCQGNWILIDTCYQLSTLHPSSIPPEEYILKHFTGTKLVRLIIGVDLG